MDGAARAPVAAFLRYAEEKHRTGHFFKDVRKVLRAHQGVLQIKPCTFAANVLGDLFAQIDRAFVAHRHREAQCQFNFCFQSVSGGCLLCGLCDKLVNFLAMLRAKGSDGAAEFHIICDHIVRSASMDLRYRHNHGISGFEATRDHGLYGSDNRCGTRYRVYTVMRHTGMPPLPLNGNVKLVSCRQQRARLAAEHSERCIRHDVERKGCIR